MGRVRSLIQEGLCRIVRGVERIASDNILPTKGDTTMTKTKRESFREMVRLVPEARRLNSECPLKLDRALQLLREQREQRPVDSIYSVPESVRL